MHSLKAYLSPDRLVADHLRGAPLFADLPNARRDCLALLREGAFFDVPAGVDVVSPGDRPALFVVAEGALRDADSARDWPAGSYFGAEEALSGTLFEATISTVAATLIYRLDAALLDAFLTRCPAIAARLYGDFAETTHATAAAPVDAPAERVCATLSSHPTPVAQ